MQARICATAQGNLQGIKEHPFFAGVSFGNLHDGVPARIPRLSELCVRAIGDAAVASRTRDKRLLLLQASDRTRVMHYLSRTKHLHEPRIFRSFHESLPDSRCLRAQSSVREYVGLEYELQGHWGEAFAFVHVAFASRLKAWAGDANSGEEVVSTGVKATVSAINRFRPRVCVVSTDFSTCSMSHPTVDIFRKQISRISESIPLVFVAATPPSLQQDYVALFGADFFGFWYGGMRGLVLNSALIVDEATSPASSEAQEAWFDGEVEQGQLGGHHVCVFTYHMWYKQDALHEDEIPGLTIPRLPRLRWLRKMQRGKVRALFEGAAGSNSARRLKPNALSSEDQGQTPEPQARAQSDEQLSHDDGHEDSEDDDSEEEVPVVETHEIEVIATAESVPGGGASSDAEDGLRIIAIFEVGVLLKLYVNSRCISTDSRLPYTMANKQNT